MTPKSTSTEPEPVPQDSKPAVNGDGTAQPKIPDPDPLPPAIRKAFEESWKRDEAAYRYLGR